MESKEIDLSNIKVAIFDFDETLAIHEDKDYLKHRNETEENLINYYLNAYLNPEIFYETIEPCSISKKIQELIKKLEKRCKIYCVSGMKFSFHLKAKEHFVHKYYSNDIEVISTRTQELKCEAVKILKRINNCKLNEILFVDEHSNIVSRLYKEDYFEIWRQLSVN